MRLGSAWCWSTATSAPELAEYNAEALRDGRAWLLARPVGRQIWIGPLFRPGLTGCWECLAHRLRTNSPVATYLAGRNGRPAAIGRRHCRLTGHAPGRDGPHGQRRRDLDRPG